MPKLMRPALVACASALGLTTTAHAAAWDGFYVGATAGASRGAFDVKSAPLISRPFSSFFGSFGGTVANSSPKFDMDGGEYGATAGHNWQRGAWVYGIELDGSGSDAKGSLTIPDRPLAGTNRFTTTLQADIDYTATLRARVGYALGPLMVFGTAGGAAMGVNFQRNYSNVLGARITGGAKQDYTGFAYGGGAEYALGSHWSVKAEYLRLDLYDQNFDTVYSDGSSASAHVAVDRDVLRAGVNYRF